MEPKECVYIPLFVSQYLWVASKNVRLTSFCGHYLPHCGRFICVHTCTSVFDLHMSFHFTCNRKKKANLEGDWVWWWWWWWGVGEVETYTSKYIVYSLAVILYLPPFSISSSFVRSIEYPSLLSTAR